MFDVYSMAMVHNGSSLMEWRFHVLSQLYYSLLAICAPSICIFFLFSVGVWQITAFQSKDFCNFFGTSVWLDVFFFLLYFAPCATVGSSLCFSVWDSLAGSKISFIAKFCQQRETSKSGTFRNNTWCFYSLQGLPLHTNLPYTHSYILQNWQLFNLI